MLHTAELQAKMSRNGKFLRFLHHNYQVSLKHSIKRKRQVDCKYVHDEVLSLHGFINYVEQ